MPPSELELELQRLEADLKRLESEYNMFFAGRLRRPPWDTRGRVEAVIKQIDRRPIQNTGERFRFHTIQSRYATLVDLWDRGLRAREEGRSGPFSQARRSAAGGPSADARVMHVAAFRDPMKETDNLHQLYDSLVDARRSLGEAAVPFHRFTELVKGQVDKLRQSGSSEVAFRVALKDGKVSFTAKPLKGKGET